MMQWGNQYKLKKIEYKNRMIKSLELNIKLLQFSIDHWTQVSYLSNQNFDLLLILLSLLYFFFSIINSSRFSQNIPEIISQFLI